MKRKKPINTDMMRDIEPLTDNQQVLFNAYAENKNLVANVRSIFTEQFPTVAEALNWQ